MKLATGETYKAYFVTDHEDNARTYQFNTVDSAKRWAQELIEVFETDPENITVYEREYDEFGNWLSQKYI